MPVVTFLASSDRSNEPFYAILLLEFVYVPARLRVGLVSHKKDSAYVNCDSRIF